MHQFPERLTAFVVMGNEKMMRAELCSLSTNQNKNIEEYTQYLIKSIHGE